VNTFSSKDKGDDRGWAAKIQINNKTPIASKIKYNCKQH